MNNYRGQIRRQTDQTPTKSSWQNERNNFQQIQQQKYSRNKDYEKSQLSYYQSQMSHTIYDNNPKNRTTSVSNNNNSNNENKQLYENLIPIKIQSSDREQYSTYLRVQIISTVEKGMNKLTLYLTDDRDPQIICLNLQKLFRKFLWLFFIKQNDFMILKKEQKLRVDFRGFPTMLMDHFDMCKSDKEAGNSINIGQCYFFSLFEMKKTEGSLNILEANKYKESIHLSLKCKLGNDEQIKQYLSDKLLKSQNENQNLGNNISTLEQALNLRKEQIARMQIQLKQSQKLNEQSLQTFNIQMSKLQTELKKDKIQNEEKIKKSLQKQYKQMKQSLEEQLTKSNKLYDELKEKNQIIQEKLSTIESKERQLNFDILTKSKELETYIKRLDEIKTYTLELENKKTEDQKIIIEQKVRIESLQSQIIDKVKIIESNSQLKSTNSHQISSLEMKSQEYKKQVQKFQYKVENLENELAKVEKSLQDYREKYEKKKEKNIQKNSIIKSQEMQINQKEKEIQNLNRILKNKQDSLKDNKIKFEENDRKINDLKRQIDECQKKIKQDNDLIIHLQKQINERTIGIRPGFTGFSSYQRSTSPFSSNASNRDYMNANSSLGNTSTSRMKFNSVTQNMNVNNQEMESQSINFNRKDVEIKRYINEDRERSKSPITNSRLNQQRDPEQMKNNQSIKPVKFKFSQKQ